MHDFVVAGIAGRGDFGLRRFILCVGLFFAVLLLQHYDDLHPRVIIKDSSTLCVDDAATIVKPGSSKFGQKVVVTDPEWNGMVKVHMKEDQNRETKSFLSEHLHKVAANPEEPQSERLSMEHHDIKTYRA